MARSDKHTHAHRFGKVFKSLDHFPSTVQFPISGGDPVYKTKVGAFFSLVMMCAIISFGVSRIIKLIKREDADVKVTQMVDYVQDDFVYEGGNEMKLAFGIGDEHGTPIDVPADIGEFQGL